MKKPDPLFLAISALSAALVIFAVAASCPGAERTPAPQLAITETPLSPGSVIELQFASPMIPAAVVGTSSVESPLGIAPALPGRFVWDTVRSGRYIVTAAPAFDTAYSFSLADGLTDLAGNAVDTIDPREVRTEAFEIWRQSPRYFNRHNANRRPKLLLEFTGPVDLEAAKEQIYFIDGIRRRRPATLHHAEAGDYPPDLDPRLAWGEPATRDRSFPRRDAIVVSPAEPLPVGENWKLEIEKGIPALGGGAKTDDASTVEIGYVQALHVSRTDAWSQYDAPRRIEINFNKDIAGELPVDDLRQWVELKPEPAVLAFSRAGNTIRIEGSFRDRQNYRVKVKAGLPAEDGTALWEAYEKSTRFEPQPPYISLPAESATRRLGSEADFAFIAANVKSVRVRAKLVAGDNLLYALRAYELYTDSRSGGDDRRGAQAVPYDAVAGKTIYEKTFPIDEPLDASARLQVPWEEILGSRGPGAVFIDVEGAPREELKRKGGIVAQSLIQVTGLGLAMKFGRDDASVFVFSQETGKPVAGLELTVHDRETTALQRTRTGADGVARVSLPEKAHWILAASGEDGDRFAARFSSDDRGLPLWRYGVPVNHGDPSGMTRRTLMFSDRPVYQPGETLHLKALTRFVDGAGMRFPADGKAQLKLTDSRNRVVLARDVTFSPRGSLDEDIVLPGHEVGWYNAMIDFEGASEGNANYWERHVNHYFRVDEYRPNTFEIELESGPVDESTSEVPLSLSARYFMGKSLSRALFSWSATLFQDRFRPEKFDDYFFGRDYRGDDEEHRGGPHTWHGRGELAEDGTASLVLSTAAGENGPGPKTLRVTTEVTDLNQQTISASKSIPVASSDFHLGLRRLSSVHRAGAPVAIEAVAVTPAGELFPGETRVRCLVERREWNAVRMKTAGGGTVTRNEPVWITEHREDFVLDGGGAPEQPLMVFTPQSSGDYSVTLTSEDAMGRPVEARLDFYLYEEGGDNSFARHDGTQIDLEPDRESYAPGETAVVAVKSPIAGTALITVERDRVRRHFIREIAAGGAIVEIPIEDGEGPNLFVSALVVRGAADCPRKKREPEFKLGYCQLRVDDRSNLLDVAVAADSPAFQPGETVLLEGSVRDAAGNPAPDAEVTLFAVDEGVLSLMGYQTPDPFATFNAPFPLSVRSAVTLTSLLREDPEDQVFGNKGRLIGGGGDEGRGGPDRRREDFKACAFWAGSLSAGKDGRFRAAFAAPDSLTRYRVIAVAHAGTDRFGAGEGAFEVNKPLMIEPALARFGNVGDTIMARGIVHNMSTLGGKFEVTLTLDATSAFDDRRGFTERREGLLNPKRSRQLSLAAGETGSVAFPIKFIETGSAAWTWEVEPAAGEALLGVRRSSGALDSTVGLTAQNAKRSNAADDDRNPKENLALRDARLSRFEIAHPVPLLKESFFTRLAPGENWDNVLARAGAELLQGKGTVTVSISRNRIFEAADALDYILRYPYGCVEQTTSSLLPWLRLLPLRDDLYTLRKTDDEIRAAIQGGADRLLTMQTTSGGLGYWPGDDKPMLWGTAYGGLGLTLAKQQGANVPDWKLEPLYQYLSAALRAASKEESQDRLIDLCLGAYTLAVAGRPEHSYHELLYDRQKELSREARCFLAMAVLESGGDRKVAESLIAGEENDVTGWKHWLGGTYYRSLHLMAWATLAPDRLETEQAATELLKLRNREGHWGSTHTSGWAVLALAQQAGQFSGEKTGALACEVRWGEESGRVEPSEGRGDASLALALNASNRTAPLRIASSGEAPVIVNVRVESRPEVLSEEPLDQGFKIARTYREVFQDGSLAPAADLEIGDLVLVQLDVESEGPARYMVVDDPLPCLFEAINPNFKSQRGAGDPAGSGDALWSWWDTDYKETRADRVVFFRNWLPQGGQYRLQYLARVIAEGSAVAPPAKVEEMYDPERLGLSAPARFEVPKRNPQAPREVAGNSVVGGRWSVTSNQ